MEPAEFQNLEELTRIERECFTIEAFTKGTIASLLKNPKAIVLLGRVNDEVAGFIIGLIENREAIKIGRVYTVDVAVQHRRRGIGSILLRELEKAFVKSGIQSCYLEVRVDNEAARRLYRKQGYVEFESLNDYYSEGVHGVRLRKQLKRRQTAPSHI